MEFPVKEPHRLAYTTLQWLLPFVVAGCALSPCADAVEPRPTKPDRQAVTFTPEMIGAGWCRAVRCCHDPGGHRLA